MGGWVFDVIGNWSAGGVMDRDDARPVARLQGGRAPATGFGACMRQATSDIPVSELTTSFDLPGNQREPDDEVYGIIENGVSTGQLVDPDGMPIDRKSVV